MSEEESFFNTVQEMSPKSQLHYIQEQNEDNRSTIVQKGFFSMPKHYTCTLSIDVNCYKMSIDTCCILFKITEKKSSIDLP